MVVWWGSLAPLPPDTLPQFRWSDKVVHLLMYAVLCGCIRIEYYRVHREAPLNATQRHRLLAFALIAPILMGGLIELAQAYLTTGRSGDWADFAANTLGCFLAAAVAKAFAKH